MSDEPRYSIDEFERESRYIETLVWDALVIGPQDRVLFCGFGPDGRWVKRAIDAGAAVTVIEHRDASMREFASLGAQVLRGSTSVIPAKEQQFDLCVAAHYLHECDPFFHAQIVFELARVGKRVAVVEPAPPADPLGKRIAVLYSQAKRELGQFEYYQPLEYWKKLLQSVKADVSQHVFAFAKVPPLEYLRDTIALILDTMAAEDVPRAYLDELRAIAGRSDVQILPPARYVLCAAAAGELKQPVFTPREEPSPTPQLAQPAAIPSAPAPPSAAAPLRDAGWEFPPIDPPTPTPAPADTPAVPFFAPVDVPPVPGFVPGLPLGAPVPPAPPVAPVTPPPFGAPFAVPPEDAPAFGLPDIPGPAWQWEPPEELGEESPP